MKVLAVCSYPTESAATRFRLDQYVEPLRRKGIDLMVKPFLDSRQFEDLYRTGGFAKKAVSLFPSVSRRISQTFQLSGFDLLFVQREAMIFGPAVFEELYRRFGRMPMVLDLDDATYIKYESPNFGKVASSLKFFGKTDRLIDNSVLVVCGNRFIADYVRGRGRSAEVIPTISDPQKFRDRPPQNAIPIIGWIGTNSTFPFLKRLFPVISKLAQNHDFELRIIGSGKKDHGPEGANTKFEDWDLERETNDFQSFDIGLYPIFKEGSVDENWLAGKSGFKAIQYLSAGTPFVMSPVGVCSEIGVHAETHFNASTDEDWYNWLDTLLNDRELSARMGRAGRRFALENYSLQTHSNKLADALKRAVGRKNFES